MQQPNSLYNLAKEAVLRWSLTTYLSIPRLGLPVSLERDLMEEIVARNRRLQTGAGEPTPNLWAVLATIYLLIFIVLMIVLFM